MLAATHEKKINKQKNVNMFVALNIFTNLIKFIFDIK